MSNEIFPALAGISVEMKVNSRFKTEINATASGGEARAGFSAYPLWVFKLNVAFLDETAEGDEDLERLHGFILRRRGNLDTFLYQHPSAMSANGVLLGVGDGAKTAWPLMRMYGGFAEPVENPDAVAVFLDGQAVDPGDYAISQTGALTFSSAPSAGQAVTWTGTYFFRCRFDGDETDFSTFAVGLHSHDELTFLGSPANLL